MKNYRCNRTVSWENKTEYRRGQTITQEEYNSFPDWFQVHFDEIV